MADLQAARAWVQASNTGEQARKANNDWMSAGSALALTIVSIAAIHAPCLVSSGKQQVEAEGLGLDHLTSQSSTGDRYHTLPHLMTATRWHPSNTNKPGDHLAECLHARKAVMQGKQKVVMREQCKASAWVKSR